MSLDGDKDEIEVVGEVVAFEEKEEEAAKDFEDKEDEEGVSGTLLTFAYL